MEHLTPQQQNQISEIALSIMKLTVYQYLTDALNAQVNTDVTAAVAAATLRLQGEGFMISGDLVWELVRELLREVEIDEEIDDDGGLVWELLREVAEEIDAEGAE